MKPVILVACDYYLPGFKAGGPIRTLANMVEALGDEFHFKVVTRNRDFSQNEPYPGLPRGQWTDMGKAQVFYMSDQDLAGAGLLGLIRRTPHQLLYLNSFFSPKFSIGPLWWRRLRLLPAAPVVLAPRGEMAPGALAIKHTRKKLFLWAARAICLHRGLLWQASSPYEKRDIIGQMGAAARVAVAPDVPPPCPPGETAPNRPPKTPALLRLVYLGRIARNKNLLGVLAALRGASFQARLDIWGILEDPEYWEECQREAALLPPGVRWRFRGELPHGQVDQVLSSADLLFLPSHGENFGHVILEALLAACPVLISDRTPWRGLANQGAGWDLPLEDPAAFAQVLSEVAAMDENQHRALRQKALAYGRESLARTAQVLKANRGMFLQAMGQASHGDGCRGEQ